jgi:hypothetical protein
MTSTDERIELVDVADVLAHVEACGESMVGSTLPGRLRHAHQYLRCTLPIERLGVFHRIDQAKVERYAELLRWRADQPIQRPPAVVVDGGLRGEVMDGCHRVKAAQRAGLQTIECLLGIVTDLDTFRAMHDRTGYVSLLQYAQPERWRELLPEGAAHCIGSGESGEILPAGAGCHHDRVRCPRCGTCLRIDGCREASGPVPWHW